MRTTLGTIRLIAIAMLALLLTACGPRMMELSQPPARLVQYGYSFMPLDEPGWKVAARSGQKVVLGKTGASRDETLIIIAGHIPSIDFDSAAEFRDWVEQQAERGSTPSERYTIQKKEITMLRHAGADCGRVDVVTLDHQAVKRSGSSGDMVLQIMQLFCRHPDDIGTVTILSYSRRAYPGSQDPQFAANADRLLDSLEFSNF